MMQKCSVFDDYVLDPHTAVGMMGARMLSEETEGKGTIVLLATAHPAKFPDAVRQGLAFTPSLPNHLAGLMEREEKYTVLENNLRTVEDFIRQRSRVSGKRFKAHLSRGVFVDYVRLQPVYGNTIVVWV